MSDRDGNDEVYIMNADGTGQTRLTTSLGQDGLASFSPDGSRIAFVSNAMGVRDHSMNIDGSGQTRLTDNTDHR
jgi:Tol biopolymer transport system component